jgi:ATP phosphoribosyltransferase
MGNNNDIIFAVPKGRILEELSPRLRSANIIPENDFYNENSRKLIFTSNHSNLKFIKVRSFDIATFVASGVAQIAVCGSDVIDEFNYENIYSILDLNLGKCRLSIAGLNKQLNYQEISHLKITTKYVNIAKKYFAKQGVQAECIKLNGAMELAPKLNLSKYILDLVSTGKTLKENNMVEIEKIADVSSKLIVNKLAFKTKKTVISNIIKKFENAKNC